MLEDPARCESEAETRAGAEREQGAAVPGGRLPIWGRGVASLCGPGILKENESGTLQK